jgi:beta-lactam-binding protein with PASTA domain
MSNFSGYWSRFRNSKFFIPVIVLFGLIVFVFFMDLVAMPFYVRLGDETELPDVVEMNVPEATKSLQDQGFSVILADSVYDANYEKGIVVEQMPPPYSTVKTGRHVYLTVSIGEKPIIMPNLFYISPRDAELTLNSYGLELGSKFYEYDDASPEGVVIAQSYPQGQKVKLGTRINITISLGPFPERKTIPQLVGKSLEEARRQLQILGVTEITIDSEEKENILPQTVLKQSLQPGTPIGDQQDMAITLTVSEVKKSGDN